MLRNVLSYMGMLLEISAIFSMFPLILSLVYREDAYPFFIMTLVLLYVGIILEKTFPKLELTVIEGIQLTALSFIVLSLIGSIPYIYYLGDKIGLLNSLFESVSGFTTTGLTVFSDPSVLPKSLLFWRSFTQWLGGLGIIIVFLAVIRASSISTINLFISQNIERKIGDDMRSIVRRMIGIYTGYTLLGVVLFYFAGLNIFESVNYALTSISTGGFQTSSSFPSQSNVLLVAMIMMVVGSTSFVIHSQLLHGKFKNLLKSVEARYFFVLFLFISLYVYIQTRDPLLSIFQVLSGLTTTGYQIHDLNLLKETVVFVILLAMLMGGNVNSTAGGIKTARVGVMLSSIYWTIKKMTAPRKAVVPFKFGDDVLSNESTKLVFVFFFTYLLVVLLSTLLGTSLGYSLRDSAFQSASAIGTVGLNTLDISTLSPFMKINLMVLMLLGRLEIFPFIVLFKR